MWASKKRAGRSNQDRSSLGAPSGTAPECPLYLDRTRNADRDRRDLYIRGRAGRSAADRAVRPSSKAQRQ
jgi:hypothetical protein